MLNGVESNPFTYTPEKFGELLLTLSSEDIEEIHDALHKAAKDLETSQHVVKLLEVLWAYR